MNELFLKYYKGGRILDMGCGWGSAVNAHIRLDKAAIILGTKTCANVFADFHYLPFKSNSIGYIYSNHSIEHAKYQDKALIEWTRVLKPNGVLHLCWPGWLERREAKEYRDKFKDSEEALSKHDMELYKSMGMDPNWVSTDPAGKWFLDAHWDVCGLDEMLTRIPTALDIIYTNGEGDTTIIAKKRAE